jgi:hypothetical protein
LAAVIAPRRRGRRWQALDHPAFALGRELQQAAAQRAGDAERLCHPRGVQPQQMSCL